MKHKESLYDKLIEYGLSNYYPYHMPGHKRSGVGEGPLADVQRMDITEIEGFDNLHHAEGILKNMQDEAAKAYGAQKSFYLVGGSTTGILTAISALIPRNGRILIARNCHKSVYHAIFLRGLKVSYLNPELEGEFGVPMPVNGQAVERALKAEPDIQAVLITSPTYEGLVADVEGIAKVVHEAGIPLIVDEAHGAHFGFADMLPESSVAHADVVVHSTHKTTRAMTQTALLHVCSDRVDAEEIQRYLDIYMTSSPSYVLMASIEIAVRELAENGQELYETYRKMQAEFLEAAEKLRYFHVLQVPGVVQDPCKLVIGSRGIPMSGQELYDVLLEKYQLQMELCQGHHILAIMTPYDRSEGFNRLLKALRELDEEIASGKYADESAGGLPQMIPDNLPVQQLLIEEAWRRGVPMPIEECEDRICSEFVYQYPPGTPIIVPGEVWNKEQIAYVKRLYEMGYEVLGTQKIKNTIYCFVIR